MKKKLKQIANKIIELEKGNFNSDSALELEISNLIEGLTFADLCEIDNYILESNKLKN